MKLQERRESPDLVQRVLALDDDPVDLSLLEDTLRSVPGWKLQFRGFSRADEFLRAMQDERVDVAFIDYFLQGQDGLEVLGRLRDGGNTTPVIALTGRGDERTAVEFIKTGADDFLTKESLNPDLVRRTLDSVFARRRYEEEKAILEERLRYVQKLESISYLAGGIAHDFNNMLMVIQGNAEMLGLDTPSGEPEGPLLAITTTCRKMSQLIKTLGNFSRTHGSSHSWIDVGEMVKDTTRTMRHSIDRRIELRTTIGVEAIFVEGNQPAIQQMLVNLILNGVEAMPAGGVIDITVSKEEAPPDEAAQVVLEVKDQGHGIPPEIQHKIFDPYFTTKRIGVNKGTGLGLAIVWDTATRYGGDVRFSSEPGRGSTFTVRLPSRIGAMQTAVLEDLESAAGERKVLVVDDEDNVRELMQVMLDSLGYQAVCTSNAADALAILEEHDGAIDAVILDLAMPRMSGQECLERIMDRWPGMRVIVATGLDDLNLAPQLRKLGASEVLVKPFDRATLGGLLRQLIPSDDER